MSLGSCTVTEPTVAHIVQHLDLGRKSYSHWVQKIIKEGFKQPCPVWPNTSVSKKSRTATWLSYPLDSFSFHPPVVPCSPLMEQNQSKRNEKCPSLTSSEGVYASWEQRKLICSQEWPGIVW